MTYLKTSRHIRKAIASDRAATMTSPYFAVVFIPCMQLS
jgi:hypothetical protein